LKNDDIVSLNKFDLGQTDMLLHEITLTTEKPVVKQFKIPDAHKREVEKHVAEWLKLGIIQPTHRKFNSPIYAEEKKHGGIRLVQDFRALNANTHTDKYSMKDIGECIGDIGECIGDIRECIRDIREYIGDIRECIGDIRECIGDIRRSRSTIFVMIDLTAQFWQLLLHPELDHNRFHCARKRTIPVDHHANGNAQSTHPLPRFMETTVYGLPNMIIYIDDLLLHSCNHLEHMEQTGCAPPLQHGIKINLPNSHFGSKQVAYLVVQLTEASILPEPRPQFRPHVQHPDHPDQEGHPMERRPPSASTLESLHRATSWTIPRNTGPTTSS
jgi:hypothetical protein